MVCCGANNRLRKEIARKNCVPLSGRPKDVFTRKKTMNLPHQKAPTTKVRVDICDTKNSLCQDFFTAAWPMFMKRFILEFDVNTISLY